MLFVKQLTIILCLDFATIFWSMTNKWWYSGPSYAFVLQWLNEVSSLCWYIFCQWNLIDLCFGIDSLWFLSWNDLLFAPKHNKCNKWVLFARYKIFICCVYFVMEGVNIILVNWSQYDSVCQQFMKSWGDWKGPYLWYVQ